MTARLPTDVRDYLHHKVRLTDEQLQWVEERLERIEAGNMEDWYIQFFIQEGEKRRLIEAPCRELKKIQRKILDRVIYRFAVSKAAHGFAKDRSPVTNAQVHAKFREGCKRPGDWCALMVDVKEFFHSIRASTVWKIFAMILERRTSVSKPAARSKLADVLTALCVKDERLPMGAPTSPALSNIALSQFDYSMIRYAARRKRLYTRYADDIVVSGPHANDSFRKIESKLEDLNLKLNPKKTRVCRPHRAIEVTGVTINSGVPTVSRKYRRRLRAALHQTRLGLEGATTTLKLRPAPVARLVGQATWCNFVNTRHRELLAQARELERLEGMRPLVSGS